MATFSWSIKLLGFVQGDAFTFYQVVIPIKSPFLELKKFTNEQATGVCHHYEEAPSFETPRTGNQRPQWRTKTPRSGGFLQKFLHSWNLKKWFPIWQSYQSYSFKWVGENHQLYTYTDANNSLFFSQKGLEDILNHSSVRGIFSKRACQLLPNRYGFSPYSQGCAWPSGPTLPRGPKTARRTKSRWYFHLSVGP